MSWYRKQRDMISSSSSDKLEIDILAKHTIGQSSPLLSVCQIFINPDTYTDNKTTAILQTMD